MGRKATEAGRERWIRLGPWRKIRLSSGSVGTIPPMETFHLLYSVLSACWSTGGMVGQRAHITDPKMAAEKMQTHRLKPAAGRAEVVVRLQIHRSKPEAETQEVGMQIQMVGPTDRPASPKLAAGWIQSQRSRSAAGPVEVGLQTQTHRLKPGPGRAEVGVQRRIHHSRPRPRTAEAGPRAQSHHSQPEGLAEAPMDPSGVASPSGGPEKPDCLVRWARGQSPGSDWQSAGSHRLGDQHLLAHRARSLEDSAVVG